MKVEAGRVMMLGFCVAFDRTYYPNFERRSLGFVILCFAIWFTWDKDTEDGGE